MDDMEEMNERMRIRGLVRDLLAEYENTIQELNKLEEKLNKDEIKYSDYKDGYHAQYFKQDDIEDEFIKLIRGY